MFLVKRFKQDGGHMKKIFSFLLTVIFACVLTHSSYAKEINDPKLANELSAFLTKVYYNTECNSFDMVNAPLTEHQIVMSAINALMYNEKVTTYYEDAAPREYNGEKMTNYFGVKLDSLIQYCKDVFGYAIQITPVTQSVGKFEIADNQLFFPIWEAGEDIDFKVTKMNYDNYGFIHVNLEPSESGFTDTRISAVVRQNKNNTFTIYKFEAK